MVSYLVGKDGQSRSSELSNLMLGGQAYRSFKTAPGKKSYRKKSDLPGPARKKVLNF